MSSAVAHLDYIRGETITFGLRAADPAYDGTETVRCDIKRARYGSQVPAPSAEVALSITPTFAPAADDVAAAWHFEITSEQSAMLEGGAYITDAKITYADGRVDYPRPLGISISERVTV